MKKILFVLSLVIATSFTAFAQKPIAGAKGFTFGANLIGVVGVSNTSNAGDPNGTLLFRYYIADGLAARLGVGFSKTSNEDVNDNTTTAGTKTTVTEKGGNFAITLGIQKSLGESEKLEPYIGADFLFGSGIGANAQEEDLFEVTDATKTFSTTDVNGDFQKTVTDLGKTSRIGFLPTLGFNYYFTENFAIGAEFNFGFIRTKSGTSTETFTSRTNGVNDPFDPTTDVTITGTDFTETEFGTFGQGVMTVSVFF